MTATVRAARQSPAFNAALGLRLTAHDPELRARPSDRYDFTLPQRVHPRGG
jgi:hypothetical protein